ncbi:MAG: exo-beta-1,3-glucanase [Methylomonas sp.]|nr:exo-beta-1,3-glucanase [Methylomonas sp.]PPD19474.1 MAG: exo-beta-1,3-glucanase [Methylomonas sp.]PPD25205.1 MAG: exo-beta-1,3-glucanase [Methylomonas sp.]PPD34867.1 MAG: exo-beta-1,3-glucanase [Methylomonas sp.]PPD38036.1 MAG: exo-beta-1,3-glucanase [Methylomonas sp.]
MPIARLLLCCVFIVLVHTGIAWFIHQPQDVGPDVPAGKLMSLSFAPFREGYSPLDEVFPPPEHVDEDLRLLSGKTYGVRTYASLGGMQPVPELARKHGLTVTQGAWLGSIAKDNAAEVEALIASANTHPDVVKRVIVGNEVLLRGEMNVDRLIDYIRQVKRAVKQPVSYADVWSMYMKHPQLFNEVDFITIHILPYWEDEPIAVERAGEHLETIVRQVEDEARGIAPGKPILIGESGWPSAGRQRGMAAPGVVNAARFTRDMIQVTTRHGFDYNIVEAFNQPWKSHLEGVVGANWGLLSADREPVFPLTGPVQENPDWRVNLTVALLIWLAVVAVFRKTLIPLDTLPLIAFLLVSQLMCSAWVSLNDVLWYTSYTTLQRSYTVFMSVANAVLGCWLLLRMQSLLAGAGDDVAVADKLRKGYLLFIAIALFKTFNLAIAGRYLSFPLEQFAIPVIGILGLSLAGVVSRHRGGRPVFAFDRLTGGLGSGSNDYWLAWVLGGAIIAMIAGETVAFLQGRDFVQAHPTLAQGLPVALHYTLANRQLLTWLFCLLILALPFCRSRRPPRPENVF